MIVFVYIVYWGNIYNFERKKHRLKIAKFLMVIFYQNYNIEYEISVR